MITSDIRASLLAAVRAYAPDLPIRSEANPAPPEPYWDVALAASQCARETGSRWKQTDRFRIRLAGASEEQGMDAVSALFEQLEYLQVPGRILTGSGISAERTEAGLDLEVQYVYHLLKTASAASKMNTLTQEGTIKHG